MSCTKKANQRQAKCKEFVHGKLQVKSTYECTQIFIVKPRWVTNVYKNEFSLSSDNEINKTEVITK